MSENIETSIQIIEALSNGNYEILKQCNVLRILIQSNDMQQHHNGYIEGLAKADEIAKKLGL